MSNVLNAFYNSQNQIIDVTKDCEFQWVQEPKSCYAYLQVSSASGDFTDGETVTGQNSGATATVFSSYVNGGRVYVTNVSGTFQTGETITGDSSNQTATVDGFIPERSWTSTPNNITHGIFPDSIISKDFDDYLEWESTLAGAGYVGWFNIRVPSDGIYSFVWLFGTGIQVDSKIKKRFFRWRTTYTFSPIKDFGFAEFLADFDSYVGNVYSPSNIFLRKTQRVRPMFYQNDKATFRWRIHNIRVLKLVI